MIAGNKKVAFIATIICLMIFGGLLVYYRSRLPEEGVVQNTAVDQEGKPTSEIQLREAWLKNRVTSTSEQIPISQPSVEGKSTTKLMSTESVDCGNQTYLFDLVEAEEYDYANDIYKNTRASVNFMTRLKAPGGGTNAFSVLAVPKENCNRIYLTVALYGSGRAPEGIFEWRIGEQQARELAISKEYRGVWMGPPRNEKDIISPDGEKIVVAQRLDVNRAYCDFRILRLLNLRGDSSSVLVQSPEDEALNINKGSGEDSVCVGADVSWLNDSTIEYVVYDAKNDVGDDIEYPPSRPLKERRTIKIP